MRTEKATRQPFKYGASVTTPSLVTRVVLTVLLLATGAALGLLLLNSVHKADTRVAALAIFGLGLWILTAPLALAILWQVSAEWRRLNYSGRLLERRLRSVGGPTQRTDPVLLAMRAPCPVCGQQGPRDVAGRTRCSACYRPWKASRTEPGLASSADPASTFASVA